MSEQKLISAEQAKETLEHDYAYAAAKLLDEVPTINPETLPIVQELRAKLAECEPVVHAHWIDEKPAWEMVDGWPKQIPQKKRCSRCEKTNKNYAPPYCPHCGAKMDEDTEE